jgi:hypothetical protein
MPPEDDKETSELEELRASLAQKDAELGLILQEKAALEELVMNGPALAEIARQSQKGKEVEQNDKTEEQNSNTRTVDPQKLAEATVATAQKTAQQVTKDTLRAEKEKDVAQKLYNEDPKFKLYIEEIKSIARQHPSLSVQEAYNLALSQNPGKKEEPTKREEPRTRDVGRIRDVREQDSKTRFSGVPKVRNPEDRESYHDDRFHSAIEAGLKAAGFD